MGLEGVALTEHAHAGYEENKQALDSVGVTVIPGREVSCGSHHILVAAVSPEKLEKLPSAVSPADLDSPDLACIWAHPAFPSGSSTHPFMTGLPPEVAHVLHGVEVLNGRRLHLGPPIAWAAEEASRLQLSATAGSDAHRIEEVGRCFTMIDSPSRDPVDVIRALRSGKTQPVLSKAWAELHGYDYRSDLRRFLG